MTDAATPSSDPPAEPPRSAASLRQDVISGYVLAAARVGAWAGVTAYLYREAGPGIFATFALLRSTIAILGYTSLGLAPAMVHALSGARYRRSEVPLATALPTRSTASDVPPTPPPVLSYAGRLPATLALPVEFNDEQRVAGAGVFLAKWMAVLGIVIAYLLALAMEAYFSRQGLFRFDDSIRSSAFFLGAGVAIRIVGEPASAILQTRENLAADNMLVAAAEVFWALTVLLMPLRSLEAVAASWALCSFGLTVARVVAVNVVARGFTWPRGGDRHRCRHLLSYGSGVTVAQTADFLYAPCSLLVIQSLLGSTAVAAYAPLVQIDAALLLVVAGIAGAVFPRAAKASAAGDLRNLRQLYLRGTLASFALLGVAAIVTLVFSDRLFRLWLGEAPPDALAILPLVLIHTVIGGSSGVGRAVLLGMGKVRPFVTASLIAGFGNVILGAILAGPVGLGLKGIVIATIAVVVARCAIWMPWYLLRLTKDEP